MRNFSNLMRDSIFLQISAGMIAFKVVDTVCTIAVRKFK